MKRVVFSLALVTLLVVISFASFAVSSKDKNYKHQTGTNSKLSHKIFTHSNRVIHPVDHFTI